MSEAEKERAAIVKWLRDGADRDWGAAKRAAERGDYQQAGLYAVSMERDKLIANAIERGDHLAPQEGE